VKSDAQLSSGAYEVFTADQAADIIGVTERAVLEAAKRREANGRPISWARGEAGNPMGCALLLASWVLNRAADTSGPCAEVQPAIVVLPILDGVEPVLDMQPVTVADSLAGGEISSRLVEAERVADGYRREATEERIARLEAEAVRWRDEAVRATNGVNAELERWKADAKRLAAEIVTLSAIVGRLASTVS
jgi:hypothetical protein